MELIIQQIVSGIATGSLYSLLAVGIVLILKTTGVANFAQGELAMFGTFVALTFINLNYNIYISAFFALLISGVVGWFIYRGVLSRFNNAPHLSTVIVTLGLYFCFHALAGIIWGHETHKFPSLFSESNFHIQSIVISKHHIGIIVTTIIIASLLTFFFKKTNTGIATSAVAQNPYAAKLMGINIDRIYLVSWIIGSILAVLAGILFAPVVYLDEHMMGDLLIKAFVAAVIGGLASIPGAFLGGILLGLFESLSTFFISGEMKDMISFILVILILFVKPEGLLGKVYKEKV